MAGGAGADGTATPFAGFGLGIVLRGVTPVARRLAT